ncbi:hypothetical protein [Segatella sp.]
MKKFFTLIAAVALAASVNAQTTLIDYPTSQSGITLHNVDEQISFATVKIHTNKDAVPCIKIGKSFSANDLVVDNFVELTTEGGFKKGDVITVSGVFNNSDNTKKAAVAFFTGEVGEKAKTYHTTEQFINSKLVADDPAEEQITLTEDMPSVKFGRSGNTGACVVKVTVVRGGTGTGISSVNAAAAKNDGKTYNLAGQEVSSSTKGLIIKNGKKYVK